MANKYGKITQDCYWETALENELCRALGTQSLQNNPLTLDTLQMYALLYHDKAKSVIC